MLAPLCDLEGVSSPCGPLFSYGTNDALKEGVGAPPEAGAPGDKRRRQKKGGEV